MIDGTTTANSLLARRASLDSDGVAACARSGFGVWQPTTWRALVVKVDTLARGMLALGLHKGDVVGIMARTRLEWQLVELASWRVGAVVVGIEAHAAPAQIEAIIARAGIRFLFTDDVATARKVSEAQRAQISRVFAFDLADGSETTPGIDPWTCISSPRDLSAAFDEVAPDDAAIIVFTSGTTGAPKGVCYSHRQLLLACRVILETFPTARQARRVMAWLPLAALFQRVLNLAAIAVGATSYFVSDPRNIMAMVVEVKPDLFTAVPQFFEKLYSGMDATIAAFAWPKRLFARLALAVGARMRDHNLVGTRPSLGLSLLHGALDLVVLSAMRRVMGGRVSWMISGSAPLAPKVTRHFGALGMPVFEAYGLTENVVPIAANRFGQCRVASVGKPLPTNEVRITADGEIWVRGPGLFNGYLGVGRPTERFAADGFYRTGDCGHFDADGYLYITGRSDEIVKLSSGKKVAPSAIEAAYRQSRLVDDVVVFVEAGCRVVALVVPNVAELVRAAPELRQQPESGFANDPRVAAMIARDLRVFSNDLAPHERLRAFSLLPGPLSIAASELTATLKPRRAFIASRHHERFDVLFQLAADTNSCPKSPAPADVLSDM